MGPALEEHFKPGVEDIPPLPLHPPLPCPMVGGGWGWRKGTGFADLGESTSSWAFCKSSCWLGTGF